MANQEKPIEVRVQGQETTKYIPNPDPQHIRMYYEYCQDNFRKGKDYNLTVEFFQKISGVQENADGLTLAVQGGRIFNSQIDSDGELRPVMVNPNDPDPFDAWMKVEVIGDSAFRILGGMGTAPVEHNTVMTEGVERPAPGKFQVVSSEQTIVVKTAKAALEIRRDPMRIRLLNANGRELYRQNNDDHVLDFTHETFPFGFVSNPATGERIVSIPSHMKHDEMFYGFGEQYSPTLKNQQEVDIFITDPLSVGSARTYVSVPFYLSTRGYGLYVNTHFRSKFFMGNRSNRAVGCHVYGEEVIDIFLFAGEKPGDVLKQYTLITGACPMVPKWSFGLWMSRCSYKTREEVEGIADELRAHDIPCDVMNIDTDWFEVPWACDWKFGHHNFPNAPEMLRNLRDKGFRISLWQKPYITAEHLPDMLQWMDEKGWIPRDPAGRIARFNPVFDLSNPEAYQWYKDQLKALFDQGVAVIKTDMAEGVPLESDYYKYSGPEIHNIYTYLYNRAAYEATIESQGEGLLWARSGYAGSQKFPIHWAGDPFCDFEGLRYSIRSGLSMGLSGFTFWSHDIGGFLGRPSTECYIRWMQAGMFGSHVRCHGASNPREPWTFGEEAEAIFRRYDRLRYRMLPYIYSQAYVRSQAALPMMAHLVLDWPQDRIAQITDDEWTFGDALLVAPVLEEGETRSVYLPDGVWYDYWTNQPIPGGRTLNVHAPLDTLPLYARAGEMMMYGPDRQHIEGEKDSELTLCLYHAVSDDKTFIYYDGEAHAISVTFDADGAQVELPALEMPVTLELVSASGTARIEIASGSVRINCK